MFYRRELLVAALRVVVVAALRVAGAEAALRRTVVVWPEADTVLVRVSVEPDLATRLLTVVCLAAGAEEVVRVVVAAGLAAERVVVVVERVVVAVERVVVAEVTLAA